MKKVRKNKWALDCILSQLMYTICEIRKLI